MDLQSRLDRLERDNMRFRTINTVLLVVISALVIFQSGGGLDRPAYAQGTAKRANADFDVITARRMTIVDADGKPRVRLAGEKQTSPQIVQGYISVVDEIGNDSTFLGHYGNGDVLWFKDDDQGNNLFIASQKENVVMHSANQGKFNYRLFAGGIGSGLQFSDGDPSVLSSGAPASGGQPLFVRP